MDDSAQALSTLTSLRRRLSNEVAGGYPHRSYTKFPTHPTVPSSIPKLIWNSKGSKVTFWCVSSCILQNIQHEPSIPQDVLSNLPPTALCTGKLAQLEGEKNWPWFHPKVTGNNGNCGKTLWIPMGFRQIFARLSWNSSSSKTCSSARAHAALAKCRGVKLGHLPWWPVGTATEKRESPGSKLKQVETKSWLLQLGNGGWYRSGRSTKHLRRWWFWPMHIPITTNLEMRPFDSVWPNLPIHDVKTRDLPQWRTATTTCLAFATVLTSEKTSLSHSPCAQKGVHSQGGGSIKASISLILGFRLTHGRDCVILCREPYLLWSQLWVGERSQKF